MDSRKRTLDDTDSATRTITKPHRQDSIPSASISDIRDANRHANKPVSAHQDSHIVQQPRPQPRAGPSSQPLAHPRPIPAQNSTLVCAVPLQSMQSVSSQGIPARPPTRRSAEGWNNVSKPRSESASGAGGHLTSRHGENTESPRGSMGPPMSATAHRVHRHSRYETEDVHPRHPGPSPHQAAVDAASSRETERAFQFPRDAPQDLRHKSNLFSLIRTRMLTVSHHKYAPGPVGS
ncbi:hypothetical protein BJ912DRAFT_955526 [Pholiota molesta]|nr:hypothetical protein BJ912DRAFT_955526 [Pholiota molesta]